jgi:hypothetical protein
MPPSVVFTQARRRRSALYLCGKKTVHSDRKDEILANIRGIEAVLALDSSIENRLCSLQRDLADLAATFYDLSGLLEDAAPDAEQTARP